MSWATGPSPKGAIQSPEAPYGFLAADLLSGGDQYTVLWQDLRTDEVLPGARLQVSCAAKAPEPNQLALSLSFVVGDERTKETRIYDGRGEWRRIRFVVDVPAGADTGSFSVRLLHRPGYDGQVLADDVSVRLE